jgi:hypothetical protein
MKGINVFRNEVRRNPVTLESVTWGKNNFDKTTSALVFAGVLIVCSIAVGCSSDKPQPANSSSQSAMTQPPPAVTPPGSVPVAPATQAAAKPTHKKLVHRAPVTVAYNDKGSGVSFEYPRRYSLKTGEAADKLVSSDAVPMDFVSAGGVTLAAVAVPESAYPKSDLGLAFFDVSMNKGLSEEQCGEFPVPQVKDDKDKATTSADSEKPIAAQGRKLMIGNMELQSSETLASQGTGTEAAKYYHAFENGACYEFALKVATTGVASGGVKPVEREEVFKRLEKILATVKIAAKAADEATTTSSAAVTPAR